VSGTFRAYFPKHWNPKQNGIGHKKHKKTQKKMSLFFVIFRVFCGNNLFHALENKTARREAGLFLIRL